MCSTKSGDDPYTYERALKDFAPYTYLDGYYADNTPSRQPGSWPHVVSEASTAALQINLPKGCTGSKCALQSKTLLPQPLESATLKYKCVLPLLYGLVLQFDL